MRELQDQYGNTRKGLSAEGMSSLMRDQLRRRFGNSAQAHEFMRALSQPTNSARITIRNNPNYAIFSVAQFLKLLLAKDALIHFDTPAVSYASYAYYGEGVPPCIRVNVAANKRKEMLNIMRELSSLDKALTCSGLNQLKRLYGIALQ